MQSVFFVDEFLAAFGAFWYYLMVVVSRMTNQFFMSLEFLLTLVTRVVVTAKELQLAINGSIA